MKISRIFINLFAGMAVILAVAACATTKTASASTAGAETKTEASAATKTADKSQSKNQSESQAETKAAVELNTQTKAFVPDKTNVRFLGRSFYDGKVLYMAYSSTGAEFNINAKRLDVTIAGDSSARSGNAGNARVAVFVNGERKADQMISARSQTISVFNSEETVTGLVQVLKLSESSSSLAGIFEIITDVDGTIFPTDQRKLKIEFIGDSITCGYGVDDENKDHHFATSTEDNTKTYAYKTAKNLDADYSMVSISGWGIISGYTGDGTKQSNSQLPKYYDKLGFSWGNTLSGKNPSSVAWDFSKFVPDVVVINLGTNDASYTQRKADRVEEYKNAYVEFIKQIRQKNPDAYIIGSLGIMGQDLYPAVEAAVNEYKSQTGDEKICSLKFAAQNGGVDGLAADWHPTEKTHAKAGALLTAKIKEIIGE